LDAGLQALTSNWVSHFIVPTRLRTSESEAGKKSIGQACRNMPDKFPVVSPNEVGHTPIRNRNGGTLKRKTDVLQGTLALMVLKTLDVLGPLHGYGIARRIEQISGDLLAVNQGTLYPVLLKLEQEGAIASEWGASENNRRARFYRLTREGRKQLQVETQDWQQTAAIIGRFFAAKAEDLS
jgi:PadR family transcriptional regulator, regulatory protein PadR